jgi:integrase
MFSRLIDRTQLNSNPEKGNPSLHSFRHTFANHRLQKWYQAGKDPTILAPNLSVYLGHKNPAATYWYFSATPELLGAAGQLFEEYAEKTTRTPNEK